MIGSASSSRPTAAGRARRNPASERPAQLPLGLAPVAGPHGGAQGRQECRAERRAHEAERELDQAVGVEQVGDGAGRQVGGEPAADQQD